MKFSHFVVIGLIIFSFYFLSKGGGSASGDTLVTIDGSAEFDQELEQNSVPVLAYFWASW